jgi:hypothetical protein
MHSRSVGWQIAAPTRSKLSPAEQRAVVTDITLAPGDIWHNFKTLFYLEVLVDITGWSEVVGIEFRTAKEQVIFPEE